MVNLIVEKKEKIMQRKRYSEKLAMGGMLVALAFIFSYLESLFPFLIPIPGIKI